MTTHDAITTSPAPEKPSLMLLRGDRIDAEMLATLFERLTARKVTPEEIRAAAQELLDEPR